MNEKIQLYQEILFKWQNSINLISSKESNIFHRHIEDSLQLRKFLNGGEILIDLGSGAGLPGIPLAISTGIKSYLIDSDRKKTIFLQEVVRELKIDCIIVNDRIEEAIIDNLIGKKVIIVSRALANLDLLLKLTRSFLENNRITGYKLILPKGAKVLQEIEKAQKSWIFDYTLENSETEATSKIIIINHFKAV